MSQLHTMPLKVEAFLSSMTVRCMAWDERGVYLVSLAEAWLNGGFLPNEAGLIRGALNITDDATWQRIKANVIDRCYTVSEDGKRLVNRKLAAVYAAVVERHSKLAEAGKRGGQASRKPGLSQDEARPKHPKPKPKPKPNRDKTPVVPKPPTFETWTLEEFRVEVAVNNTDALLTDAEVTDFLDYWTESSASGRTRRAMEKTWNTRRRMQNAVRMVFTKRRDVEQRNQPRLSRTTGKPIIEVGF